jgi:hypothetical protein
MSYFECNARQARESGQDSNALIKDLHKSSASVQLLSLSHYFLPASNNFIWLDNHTQAHVLDEYFSFHLMRNWRGNSFMSTEKCLEKHYNFVFIRSILVK